MTTFTQEKAAQPVSPARGEWRLKSWLAAAALTLGCISLQAQVYSLSPVWSAANGVGHLANNNANRGIAWSAVSNEVFVATRAGATTGAIDVFDAASGTLLSGSGGIAGANLGIDQIGVGDDGVLYGAPLQTSVASSAGSVTVYSWTNWYNNPTPFAAYSSSSGDALVSNFTGKRIGDSLAVTGAGTNTLILLGVGGQGTNFVLLHTSDGVTFTPTVIFVPTGLPSTPGYIFGLTFYTNGSFLVQGGVNATNPSNTSIQHNVFLVSYPANFASQSTVMGTVLGNAPALVANQTVALNYSPAGQMLADVETASIASNTNSIFSLTNFPSSAAPLATVNFATPNANGNATGATALGGAGKTNFLYVLETDNGVQAYAISISSKPIISTGPVAASGVFPPYKLTVSATGTGSLQYQWLASNSGTNVSSTFTNIPNATNSAFVVSYPTTNYFEVIVTNASGAVTSAPVRLALLTPVTSTVVSQLWQVPGGTYSYLPASGDAGRGLGYDTTSQRLVVASTVGGSGLYILDANTGTNIGTLSLSGISFGGLLGGVDQVVVADDGVVYAGNLVSGSGFTLYAWPGATNGLTGSLAFSDTGALGGGDRWGDTMTVRGGGPNTQILLGSKSGTNVALLTAQAGGGFSGVAIAISNAVPGFAANGIAFGAGNTLWAKSYVGHLYEIAFDPVNLVGGVVLDYPNPSKIPSAVTGVAIDPVNNLMAGVDLGDNPNDVKLYELTGTADAPVLFAQSFFASAVGNGNANVAIVMKYPRLYALDVNNGLIGLTYGAPPITVPSVSAPGNLVAYTNIPSLAFSAVVSGSLPIYYQWQHSATTNEADFTNIIGATSSTYTLSYPPLSAAGYYQLVVHNIAGYATSAPPASLTLLVPSLSTVVTQLWTLSAGSRGYLDGSSYNTRGLAYDPNTGTLLLADHANIYLLASTNGADLGTLNTAGLPSGGNWVVDQLAVADDGVLYSCNLSLTGPGFSIIQWLSIAPGAPGTGYAFGGMSGADPSGTGDRWGDTMAIRGAGTGTEILCGSYNGSTVVVFDTTDGQTFSPHLITVTGAPAGFAGLGVAFGAGNTFWAKGGHGYNLRQVSYDKTSGVGTVINLFTAGTQVPNDLTGISVDVTNNILAGVCFNNTPNDLQLYLLSGNTNPPALFNQAFFGTNNINSNENAVTTLKGGLGFGLDVNNGITAISYGLPSAPAVTLTSVSYAPGGTILTWNNTFSGHGYQVQYKASLLDPTWTNLGSPVTGGDVTASYTDITAAGATRFYRVISQ